MTADQGRPCPVCRGLGRLPSDTASAIVSYANGRAPQPERLPRFVTSGNARTWHANGVRVVLRYYRRIAGACWHCGAEAHHVGTGVRLQDGQPLGGPVNYCEGCKPARGTIPAELAAEQ